MFYAEAHHPRRALFFGLAGLFFVIVSTCWAGDGDPDRYVDGSALGLVAARAVLSGTSVEQRERRERMRQTSLNLMEGERFAPTYDPDRRELKRRMMEAADHSITPDALFRMALTVKRGAVQPALVLIWDVLREGNFMPSTRTLLRNLQPHILKLFDITGELDRFDGNFHRVRDARGNVHDVDTVRGDNFSAWYHFFGGALYAYELARRLSPKLGLRMARAAMLTHRRLYDPQIDGLKRHELNLAGTVFGAELLRNLRRYRTTGLAGFVAEHGPADPDFIVSRPDLFGPGWRLDAEQPAWLYGRSREERPAGSYEPLMTTVKRIREEARRPGAAPLQRMREWLSADRRPEIQYAVLNALGERRDRGSLALLERCLRQGPPERKAWVLAALSLRHEPEALSLIRQVAIDSQSPSELRGSAFRALWGRRATPDEITVLTRLLSAEELERQKRIVDGRPMWLRDRPALSTEIFAAAAAAHSMSGIPEDLRRQAKRFLDFAESEWSRRRSGESVVSTMISPFYFSCGLALTMLRGPGSEK